MTDAPAAMPAYVPELGYGEQSSPAPGLIEGATTFAFALKVIDPARLQATCDHFLNTPAKGAVRYTPLGDVVFVSFMHADRLTSGAEAVGWQPDHEMSFWVPLIAQGPNGLGDRLLFWMPYIAISVSEGMTTGREVWGFRKQIGETDIAGFTDHPMNFQSRGLVYDPLATNTRGRIEPLVTVSGPGEAGGLKQLWDDMDSAIRGIHDLWSGGENGIPHGDAGLLWNTLKDLIKGEVPMVNLKQFRDAADTRLACYQALVEGPCKITALHGAGLMPQGFTATIADWASHRIAYHLGLPLTGPIPVEFGSWVKMDFTALPGREVWNANGIKEPPAPAGGCLNPLALIRRLFAGNR